MGPVPVWAEGCQGGCERRIEVIVKMQKSLARGVRFGGSGLGVFSERSYCENATKIGGSGGLGPMDGGG